MARRRKPWRKGRIWLRPSGECEQVMVPTKLSAAGSRGWSIGRVCRVNGGYRYHSAPIERVARGPVKTKATAILKVVHDYKSWMGW